MVGLGFVKMYLETDVKRPGGRCFLLPGDKMARSMVTAWTLGAGEGLWEGGPANDKL